MSVLEKINEDLKEALKTQEREKAGVLRFLLAQIQNLEIEKRKGGDKVILKDEDVLVVLKKEAKKRQEAINLFRQGGRNDLVEKEESELKFFKDYLPEPLKPEEIEAVVKEVMAKGEKEFSLIMKEVMGRLKGQADGNKVSALIKEKLGK